MLRISTLAAAVLTLGPLFLAPASPGFAAAAHDGNWSVLVITEKGACDKAFRYNVGVAGGQVRYHGDTAVSFNGTVAPNGAVKVNIRLGEQGANGTGRLSATSGTGTWRGVGGAGECTGRWEAERR
ncbi:MAG: hypothetical protein Q8M24_18740 [Pseudolabrys sp.]|nr:hypothetical protein [Pseudolabrys sp.]MDP2297483.1 hypothetical protein [Pseudolabrys sp.]